MTAAESEPRPSKGVRLELFAGPEARKQTVKALLVATWVIGWLPLAVLDSIATARGAHETLFHDVAVHARLLVALPLFIVARPLVEGLLTRALCDLFDAGIVPPEAQARVAELLRRRGRVTARPLMLLLFLAMTAGVATLDYRVAQTYGDLGWRTHEKGLSNAGLWYYCVSNPLYRLLVLRWLWGFASWFMSMVTIARCLHLDPLHPDRQGGLERLTTAHTAFALVLLGASASTAGGFANHILYDGDTLATLKPVMIATLVFLPSLVLVSLFPLVVPLLRARRRVLVEYGRVAAEQARAFDEQWFNPRQKSTEELLKSQDFSALTDLLSSYDVALKMQTFPIQKRTLIPLLAAVALPMLPVAALELPIVEVVRRLGSLL